MATKKTGRGRKLLLRDNPAILDNLEAAISEGMTYKMAAQYCDISERSLHDWRDKGKQAQAKFDRGEKLNADETLFLQFSQRLTRANLSTAKLAITAWQAQFLDDWRAARDWMARRYPDEWSGPAVALEDSPEDLDDTYRKAAGDVRLRLMEMAEGIAKTKTPAKRPPARRKAS